MRDRAFDVLIAGGGYAALEAAFRLQHIAADATQTTILARDAHLAVYSMSALTPFVAVDTPRARLAELAEAATATLRHGRMASVHAEAHEVVTDDGHKVAYDALLIAVGALQRSPENALAFGTPGSEERMHGLIQDLEMGYVQRIAFVVPASTTWPMPLYELALMTAERAYGMSQSPEVMLLTAEEAPLGILGAQASTTLTGLLTTAGVKLQTGVEVDTAKKGLIRVYPTGEQLTVDRVVTAPLHVGPAIEGLPHNSDGFLMVDRHGRVEGVPDVYAAGDVTHYPIKQAGLACQQADAAADMIAAQAGVAIQPRPYTPVLEGVLLTERDALVMHRENDAAGKDSGVVSSAGRWRAPTKMIGQELAAHLAAACSRA